VDVCERVCASVCVRETVGKCMCVRECGRAYVCERACASVCVWESVCECMCVRECVRV